MRFERRVFGDDTLPAWLRLRGGAWGRLTKGRRRSSWKTASWFIDPHLRQKAIDRQEREMVAREHGLSSIKDVRLAVLETDGSISIVPMTSSVMRSRKHVRQFRKR